MLALTFMLLLVVELGWATQCNKWSGPAGTVECVLLPGYNNEYQWGTCLTDTYIKQKSKQKHQCADQTRIYCWYQCMIEVHNKEYGSVTDDCSCNPSNPTSYPNTLTPTTLLPPECYSPSGDSCDWYRNCLLPLKGMWNIGEKCGLSANIKKCYRELKDGPVRVIKMKIKKFLLRSRRSTDNLPQSDAQSRFADGVGSAIASALKWNSDVMDWLAYTGRVEDTENLEIVLLLADKKALGIGITSTPSVNFNQTIQEFASAVKQGALPLKVDGHNVWVKSLASCSDKACNSTHTLAVSDKPPNWNGAAEISGSKVVLCGTIAVLVMMMDKLLY